jgi:transcriptional regulator with XRE-family HTH domain
MAVLADARRVKQIRLKKCLSREDFALEYGIDPRTLKKIEDGEPVSYGVVRELAKRLEMEQPDELLAADGGSVRCTEPDQEWTDLVGRWAGRIEQPRGPDGEPYAAEVRLEFTRDAGGFVGRYSFTFEGRTYRCTGPVRGLGRGYFKFDAESADGRMSNTFYFQITRAGDGITGRYVGFGPHSNRVVSGRASAKKTFPPADAASRPRPTA